VARYGKKHKDVTRQRIIEAAGRRLKRDGIDGAGVATLMADAGLTNGAFYAHFESKDDLVATAVAAQLREQCDHLRAQVANRAGLEQMVREYLSPEHRDDVAGGCTSAALLDEIARSAEATQRRYTDSVLAIADHLATLLAPQDPDGGRAQALALFALLIGTLQLSRALTDASLSDAVLAQGIENALALLRRRRTARR